jgi:hypothetical protein
VLVPGIWTYSVEFMRKRGYNFLCNIEEANDISKKMRKNKQNLKSTLDYLISIGVLLKEKEKYLGLAFIKNKCND